VQPDVPQSRLKWWLKVLAGMQAFVALAILLVWSLTRPPAREEMRPDPVSARPPVTAPAQPTKKAHVQWQPTDASAPQVKGTPVELGPFYSCSTSNAIAMGGLRDHPNNLGSFPTGTNVFGGVRFVVGGMIQLGGGYARQAPGIKVGAKASRLHLLHGTGGLVDDGTEIATLVLHYAEGNAMELPIQYGLHVRDWWMWKPNESPLLDENTAVVWEGENEFSKEKNCRIRVYGSAFENPKPDAIIERIDYVRARSAGGATPFLLGLTVE
jgi:hypothetical protein